MDDSRILRVKSKFDRNYLHKIDYPVILPKDDHFTTLLLHEYHIKLAHSGCYTILSEVRKKFFVEHIYSYIKKILKSCIVCKRMNSRPIKVNQNAYREYRVNPPNLPFQNMFLDYMGPFNIKINGKTLKSCILVFTCTWSRAINMKLCLDLSTEEFMCISDPCV